nr:hypothetical protein CFP56_10131 [Quercus suber]
MWLSTQHEVESHPIDPPPVQLLPHQSSARPLQSFSHRRAGDPPAAPGIPTKLAGFQIPSLDHTGIPSDVITVLPPSMHIVHKEAPSIAINETVVTLAGEGSRPILYLSPRRARLGGENPEAAEWPGLFPFSLVKTACMWLKKSVNKIGTVGMKIARAKVRFLGTGFCRVAKSFLEDTCGKVSTDSIHMRASVRPRVKDCLIWDLSGSSATFPLEGTCRRELSNALWRFHLILQIIDTGGLRIRKVRFNMAFSCGRGFWVGGRF